MPSMSLISILIPFLSIVRGAVILNPRQSVTPPSECDVIPTWEVTSFNWFNSSNNLDCVTQSNARKFQKQSRVQSAEEQGEEKSTYVKTTSNGRRLLQLDLHTWSPDPLRRQSRILRPLRHRGLLHGPPATTSGVRAARHDIHRHERPRVRVLLRVQPAEHPALRGRQRHPVVRRRRVPNQFCR